MQEGSERLAELLEGVSLSASLNKPEKLAAALLKKLSHTYSRWLGYK